MNSPEILFYRAQNKDHGAAPTHGRNRQPSRRINSSSVRVDGRVSPASESLTKRDGLGQTADLP